MQVDEEKDADDQNKRRVHEPAAELLHQPELQAAHEAGFEPAAPGEFFVEAVKKGEREIKRREVVQAPDFAAQVPQERDHLEKNERHEK